MKWPIALPLVTAVATIAACGGYDDDDGSPPATADSGIEGTVLAGPTCPVEQAGSPCPDEPLADAPIRITAVGGESTEFVSAADGSFRVALAPGDYVVEPLPFDSGPLPAPGEAQTVAVVAGSYTEVTLSYGTGIR